MRYIISSAKASTLGLALALLAPPARAEVPVVVTDIPPVHALAAAVMGDLGAPEMLLPPGTSPHAFALRPSQAAALAKAGLVIWIGPELTPGLEKPLANRPEGAATLALLQAGGTQRQDYAGHETGQEHGAGEEDHAGDDHGDHGDHEDGGHQDGGHQDGGHDHQGTDPHAWLNPANGRLWLGLIAAELSRLDPDHAADYAANAARAAAAIDTAEAQAAALLAPVRDRPFLTFHDAYGYFTAHFGLAQVGSLAFGDAAAPGARHMADLQALIAARNIRCLFPEAQHDPALLAQIAADAGIALAAPLDPEGSALPPGPDLYPALILSLAQGIAACQP